MATIEGVIQYTGKLGQTVGYKGRNGKNYMRVRKTSIKNPKTALQAIQRMITSTVAVAISYLTEILDNSVEGKSNGAATLDYIRGRWMNMLRAADVTQSPSTYLYLPKGRKIFVPNRYLLSQGRLAAPGFSVDGEAMIIMNADTVVSSPAQATASQLFPEVRVGDQITIIIISSPGNLEFTDAQYCRFALKDDTTPALIASGTSFVLNPEAVDVAKASGKWRELTFNVLDEHLHIYADALSLNSVSETGQCLAAGLIVSNIENKQRSTSYLELADVEALYDYLSGGDVYPTYQDSSTDIDMASDVYLNNSARRNAAASQENVLSMNPSLPFQINTSSVGSDPLPTLFTFLPTLPDSLGNIDFVFQNGDETGHVTSVGSDGAITLKNRKVYVDEITLSEDQQITILGESLQGGEGTVYLIGGTIEVNGVTYQLGND